MEEIIKYRASWNPVRKIGAISISTKSGKRHKIDFPNPAEFTALLTLLATSERAGYDPNGLIFSDTEEVDGE